MRCFEREHNAYIFDGGTIPSMRTLSMWRQFSICTRLRAEIDVLRKFSLRAKFSDSFIRSKSPLYVRVSETLNHFTMDY